MSVPPGASPSDPWWASGRSPQDGLDGSEDPFDAHQQARRGDDVDGDTPHDDPPPHDGPPPEGDATRLATDVLDLVGRLAAEAGRRVAARATSNAAGPHPGAFTRPDPPPSSDSSRPDEGPDWSRVAEGLGPHEDGRVCEACPVCLALGALRQVRPEVIGHLSDAAHHVSLALRALADAQAGGRDEGLTKIDVDP